jgi:hypothetical protein
MCAAVLCAAPAVLGTGTGELIETVEMPSATLPTQLVVGRFDDGPTLDLVISETESDEVTLMRGLGDGTFDLPESQSTGHDSQGLTAADINGDGKLDVAITSSTATIISTSSPPRSTATSPCCVATVPPRSAGRRCSRPEPGRTAWIWRT